MKDKRKRVSRDQVRDNAKKGSGGPSWFNLPDGVREWAPEAADTYMINVLPYVVTDKNHPDSVDKGTIWYKRIFTVHHGVGPEGRSLVCPKSVGQRCPIHDELPKWEARIREQLKAKEIEQSQADRTLKQLRGQGYTMFNIRDPEDKAKVALFVMSSGKFWSCDAGLKKELEEGDDGNLSFFDVKDGKTLKVRFSEETFKSNTGPVKFLQCTRIDFKDRPDADEDKVLKKTVNLDEVLVVLPFDKLKELFEGAEAKPKTGKKPKGKGKKKAKDEEE